MDMQLVKLEAVYEAFKVSEKLIYNSVQMPHLPRKKVQRQRMVKKDTFWHSLPNTKVLILFIHLKTGVMTMKAGSREAEEH